MHFILLRIITILCLGLTVTFAEESVSLQFIAIPKQIRPEPVELLIGENETIEVHTPGHELSQPYKVPALESFIVGKTVVNDAGESVFQSYGQAKSIGKSKQIILLLRKGKENADGFAVLPISGELGDFNGGSYLLINASGVKVAAKVGDLAVELAPGRSELVRPEATHEGGGLQMTFAYMRGQDWKVFRDTRWSVNTGSRSIVFFLENPSNKRIMVAPVVEMLPYAPR